ncbi:hypothetical protein PS467_00090 [Streptomyces luomodiensis]|uniref:Uncharacterized protein n=1 Tax=Streptomyces luomodiensis TaxID=3026192 RepID=A0ABY9UPI6_9ACTN|nr:hypothetical protein [Streptomyces sp. SCA4-21]WNE93855.1 hypothetical protein PS467_00090 [Streptomyces sp. SCA4-21]
MPRAPRARACARAQAGDEQLLRGRVYGCDHDDPDPGPLPHQTYAALIGGPLDGLLLFSELSVGNVLQEDVGWSSLRRGPLRVTE